MNMSELADCLVHGLREHKLKIVFAESCTGGMAASVLTDIPGVSNCFCGSAVTYLDSVKIRWLQVRQESIDQFTAVSCQVAIEMARGALVHTPAADVAVSITGHLGPDAPSELDGKVFLGLARRDVDEVITRCIQLQTKGRRERKLEATDQLFRFSLQGLFPGYPSPFPGALQ